MYKSGPKFKYDRFRGNWAHLEYRHFICTHICFSVDGRHPRCFGNCRNASHEDQWKNFSGPLLVSLLTTLIALFPIWTLKDGPGEYIHTMFPVLAITLITVFLISVVVIPLVISEKEGLSKLSTYYAKALKKGQEQEVLTMGTVDHTRNYWSLYTHSIRKSGCSRINRGWLLACTY